MSLCRSPTVTPRALLSWRVRETPTTLSPHPSRSRVLRFCGALARTRCATGCSGTPLQGLHDISRPGRATADIELVSALVAEADEARPGHGALAAALRDRGFVRSFGRGQALFSEGDVGER